MSTRFTITRLADLSPVPCPCGQARRAFVDDPSRAASSHLVEIQASAKSHYHKQHTEIYYVLQGTGEVELDGERYPVSPGDAILIKPHCRHRALGQLTILNTSIPAFDPEDEWFD